MVSMKNILEKQNIAIMVMSTNTISMGTMMDME